MYQQMTDLLSERMSGAFEPLCYSNMSHRHDNVNVSQHELYLMSSFSHVLLQLICQNLLGQKDYFNRQHVLLPNNLLINQENKQQMNKQ